MRRLSSLMVVLLLAAGAIFAQGFQPFMGANNTANSQMVNTDKGLFVLRNGVIAKYDLKTLQQDPKTLSLFGPEPTRPTDQAAMQQYMAAMQQRQAPALMVAKDNFLYVIIGNGFAKINQDTLELATPALDITTPTDPTDVETAAGVQRYAVEPVPSYVIVDSTIYLFRSKEVLAISLTDATILTRSPLAKELRPAQMNAMGGFGNRGGQGFGNRGGGPGGPGGNRGGGANQPAN